MVTPTDLGIFAGELIMVHFVFVLVQGTSLVVQVLETMCLFSAVMWRQRV